MTNDVNEYDFGSWNLPINCQFAKVLDSTKTPTLQGWLVAATYCIHVDVLAR